MEVKNWQLKHADIGTAHTLILPQYPSGRDIMLIYNRAHPHLRIRTDKLSESVHPDLVVWAAAVKLMIWQKIKTDEDGVPFNETLNYCQSMAEQAKNTYSIRVPRRKSKLVVLGNSDLQHYSNDDDWPAPSA
jgi:hypothetical protein